MTKLKEARRGKIYCGWRIFEAVKNNPALEKGFSVESVEFVYDTDLRPNQMLTYDPSLIEALKATEEDI